MPVQKLTIEDFIPLSGKYPVFDVRSPGEYNHAYIPGSYSLPLFNDEERKIVGTAYKQQSREIAIKAGLDFFGVKMKKIVEEAERIIGNNQEGTDKDTASKTIIVHCWRGGMRSAAIAWLLDLYGFKVYVLTGGYKAFRKWVLAQFEIQYNFNVIGGYTGSGKTLLLHELKKADHLIIDLEALANHKGSAFGGMGKQPSQEMFENTLARQLKVVSTLSKATGTAIYVEDESQRIGNLQLPMALWYCMRKSSVYFLDIPFEERLKYITAEYGLLEKGMLINSIIRIQKRLGGLETKNAINFILENNHQDCFRILLAYYDKWYEKGLSNRENLQQLLNKITCSGVDTAGNTQKLITCATVST